MQTRRLFLLCSAACLSALITMLPGTSEADAKTRLAVVVHKDSPVSGLSYHELKRIYLGAQDNAGGSRLVAVAYPMHTGERAGFDQAVLGMSQEEVAKYWIDRKIRGQSGPPKAVQSSAQMRQVVGQVKTAIGYIRADEVSKEMKVLPIDGKLPTNSGYPVSY